ncbi:MAG: NAD(P)-binding domain-containing protein [Proteobacteria bacterium]|nr:NAD(P)-binding domain-containing protein [Pseudomonadota bacterium]
MTIGFIGTGHITKAVVEGLCGDGGPPEPILLSPRNAMVAADLAARFDAVSVAADNQAVLDGAETVMLAVLPPATPEILGALSFRPDHLVVSLIALRPAAELAPLVAPATRICRAVPLPSAARRLGPVVYYPEDEDVAALIAHFGTPIAAASETAFHRMWTLTSLVAPYYALMGELMAWAEEGHVPPETARAYLDAMFQTLGAMASDGVVSYPNLAASAQTKGGINEQVMGILAQRDALAPWREGVEAVFQRMERGLAKAD